MYPGHGDFWTIILVAKRGGGMASTLASGATGASISAEAMITCPGDSTTLPVMCHGVSQSRGFVHLSYVGHVMRPSIAIRSMFPTLVTWCVRQSPLLFSSRQKQ